MTKESVRIAHISDLHISEQLLDDADINLEVPSRYGHSVPAFLALDAALNHLEWDALVITGDISRVGNHNSFIWARNWIEQTFRIGHEKMGLDLAIKGKPYIIVPGNHDRFNGSLIQGSLDRYYEEFYEVKTGHIISHKLKGIAFNFHLFDSSCGDGDFGLGRIDTHDLVPKIIDTSSIDIAVLHHHLFKPLSNKKEKGRDLMNCSEVVSYFLGCKFDAILFGHTHKYFSDYLYPDLITRQMPDEKVARRIRRRWLQKFFLRNLLNYDSMSYTRERTKEGKFPKISYYYEYLYIKNILKQKIKGPSKFSSIYQFYDHVDEYGKQFSAQLAKVKQHRILVSMAPSACQFEAEQKGFNLIEFIFEENINTKIKFDIYAYNGSDFQLNKSKEFRTNRGSSPNQ